MTNESIQIAIALGTWAAAIAACFAAGVSLWIATRRKRHRINVKAYSGFGIKKDSVHNIGYIRCKSDSKTLNNFSELEPMLEIIVENRGDIPFVTHTLEIIFSTNEIITLNTIANVNQEEIQFVRRVEPGESTTYFYRLYSLAATPALFEFFLTEIQKGITPKIVIRTGFEEEAFALMPKDFFQYFLEHPDFVSLSHALTMHGNRKHDSWSPKKEN